MSERAAAVSSVDDPNHHSENTNKRGVFAKNDSFDKAQDFVLNVSRVNALKRSINDHSDKVSELLSASKIASDKRTKIEAALRVSREAFAEISAAYIGLLELGMKSPSSEMISGIIKNVLSETRDSLHACAVGECECLNSRALTGVKLTPERTYSSVVSSKRIGAKNASLGTPKTTYCGSEERRIGQVCHVEGHKGGIAEGGETSRFQP